MFESGPEIREPDTSDRGNLGTAFQHFDFCTVVQSKVKRVCCQPP